MSRTDDILDKTKRKEPEAKKWKVVVVVVVSILVAFSLSFCYMYFYVDIDGYLSENKDIISLYEFYDDKVGLNETAVFFIGGSGIGHSVYPPEINRILIENGLNVSTYNLAISSDVALERSLEVQKIIDARPSLVIYGVSYGTLDKGSRLDERTKLVYSRLNIREDVLPLFTREEISSNFLYPPDFIYLQKYFRNAIYNKYFGNSGISRTYNYTLDCYGLEWRLYADTQKMSYDEIKKDVSNYKVVINSDSDRYKESLLYSVKALQDAGISVIIVNLPVHPAYSESISDESRQNFHNILNQTGTKWYDMEFYYEDSFFRDPVHALFADGALEFAPVMADLIIQEMS